MPRPLFTVVMATFGRGRHIMPSIKSVLQQSYKDYELIVVGDCCEDETAQTVTTFANNGVRWINLDRRCGSQSAPNNTGILAAKGQVIAYLGHDDIWEPTHLQDLSELFAADPRVDFGVAGAIFHLPNGIAGSLITGLFDDDSAKHSHFFPPSSFAHRKAVCDAIGYWQMPLDVKAPVDADFLLRAANADMAFKSTGKVTLHKFAAGHRYLSYLQQDCHEQETLLTSLADANHANRVATIVSDARRLNTFMIARHPAYDQFAPGDFARQNAARKGLLMPVILPLGAGVVFRQSQAECSLDWQTQPKRGIRWVGQNPKPCYLLPYTGGPRTQLYFKAFHRERHGLNTLAMSCNGRPVKVTAGRPWGRPRHWRATYSTVIDLKADAPSVLQFHLNGLQAQSDLQRGIGLGAMSLVAPFAGSSSLVRLRWILAQIILAFQWYRY